MTEILAYVALVLLAVVVIVVIRAGAVDKEKATDALEAGGRGVRDRLATLWARLRGRA